MVQKSIFHHYNNEFRSNNVDYYLFSLTSKKEQIIDS